jgi:hypothetical protein
MSCSTAVLTEGSMVDLAASDDHYLLFRRYTNLDQWIPSVSMIMEANMPGNDFNVFGFGCEAAVESDLKGVDPFITQRIEFFQFWRQRWVTVNETQLEELNRDQLTFALVDPAGFINPLTGRVRTRVSWNCGGLPFSRVRIDTAFWYTGED